MLRSHVRQFFVKRGIPPCRLAVAASGGTDSTALLLAAAALREDGFTIVAAHVNHHLRGTDSDADEAFVRGLCARLGVELAVFDGTLDPERVRARGIEAAAREVRYARLRELDARYVATAHQKNDQAETVLMRLLTGSGIAGLRGIHPVRDDGFVRPLLDVTRAEIEEFLRGEGVVPRFDRSNDDPRFLRNRVRAFLREAGGVDALANVAGQARAQWPILERAIDHAERAHVVVSEAEARFTGWPGDEWLRGALLRRHIRRLDPHARDFDALRIAREVEAIKRIRVTKELELVRVGDALVLRKPPQATEAFELELTEDHPAHFLGMTMRIGAPASSPAVVAASRAATFFQLPPGAVPAFLVRNRRNGDRFHPLGLSHPKKLKDFLIDRKIAAELRDRLPLLVWNGEIVWIAGVEVSERFKVTDPPGVLYRVWLDDDERDDPPHLHH
jgi:tRNA(Ile)-lysidine synthase